MHWSSCVFALLTVVKCKKMSVIERSVDINHSVIPKEISAVLNHCAGKESFLKLPLYDYGLRNVLHFLNYHKIYLLLKAM